MQANYSCSCIYALTGKKVNSATRKQLLNDSKASNHNTEMTKEIIHKQLHILHLLEVLERLKAISGR